MQGVVDASNGLPFVIKLLEPDFLPGERTGTAEYFEMQRCGEEKDIQDSGVLGGDGEPFTRIRNGVVEPAEAWPEYCHAWQVDYVSRNEATIGIGQ
jgi:hypothetical protein